MNEWMLGIQELRHVGNRAFHLLHIKKTLHYADAECFVCFSQQTEIISLNDI